MYELKVAIARDKRFYKSIYLLSFLVLGSIFYSKASNAAQGGPVFPSHRFPTDKSFHLHYQLGILKSSSNYVGALTTQRLNSLGKISVLQQNIGAEFQPNRKLSVGIELRFDQLKLSDSVEEVSKSGLADQRLWGEYRFVDRPGASLGTALVAKFPAYTNTTAAEIQSDQNYVFLGDAQTDLSALFTTEYWPRYNLRLRLDTGITYRTEGYASEIPYLLSIGFVNAKVDLDLKVKGNVSVGNDSLGEDESSLQTIRDSFAGSFYAFAQNPWTLIINPTVELWMSPRWALLASYDYSLMGKSTPAFHTIKIGFSFRRAERSFVRKKTFRQIDIKTDQEAGKFQGEEQLEEQRRRAAPDGRAIPEEPIAPPEEEF